MEMPQNYSFIKKCLWIPKQKILVVGDLHLGYSHFLNKSGILIPQNQKEEILKELKEIFEKIQSRRNKIKRIIFLGDIKHSFGFESEEKFSFKELFDFLKKNFNEKDIILIKGNHDTIDYTFKEKLKKFYIDGEFAFIHGDKFFQEILDKNVKTIIMGHIHPSIILSDKQNIKKEKYKCFLVGNYKNKEVIILPSFLSNTEGIEIQNIKDNFSVIPKKELINFKVFIVGENKVYGFGKLEKLI